MFDVYLNQYIYSLDAFDIVVFVLDWFGGILQQISSFHCRGGCVILIEILSLGIPLVEVVLYDLSERGRKILWGKERIHLDIDDLPSVFRTDFIFCLFLQESCRFFG